VPNFRYRALSQAGEVVSGSITAPTKDEVARRIEYLGLYPIDTVTEEKTAVSARLGFTFGQRPQVEDITTFTLDLALLLKSGAKLDDALELLSADMDLARMRPIVAKIRAAVLSGESFADAISRHPVQFSPMYVALARVGEASNTLEHILEVLAVERARAAALQRKIADALRYPAFVLFSAVCVLVFFLIFVLPQFATVLRDFGVKLDPIVATLLAFSDFLQTHALAIAVVVALLVVGGWLLLRQPRARAAIMIAIARLPLARTVLVYHRTALFCRNLGILLGAAVQLTTTLRILADMMATTGEKGIWLRAVERVRQGRKLSDALAETGELAPMAVRMLKLGEETDQLPALAGRVADFYATKLERGLNRAVGIAGPAAIVTISLVVGGLIVSVMTSLLSVSQIVG
jgi:general secretion pathway protein F